MAQQVLYLPELLENILLELPFSDLRQATQVCTSWRNVTASSPNIQKALFLAPGTMLDITLSDDPTKCRRGPHPHHPSSARRVSKGTGYILKPLLLRHECSPRKLFAWHYSGPNLLKAYEHESFRAMLISQPPMSTTIKFQIKHHYRRRPHIQRHELPIIPDRVGNLFSPFSSGTTFGEMVENYLAKVEELEVLGFEPAKPGYGSRSNELFWWISLRHGTKWSEAWDS
ncbi:hypothetical protein LTR27_000859 [Elasticomyces elasticus]|nr:hypothetical protein LTR27_000859 [Elasticomyces elasticus]